MSGELEISPCRDMIWVVYDYLWSIIMMAFDRCGLILSDTPCGTVDLRTHLDRRYLRKLMVQHEIMLESTVFRFHIFHQQRRHRTSVIILHIFLSLRSYLRSVHQSSVARFWRQKPHHYHLRHDDMTPHSITIHDLP